MTLRLHLERCDDLRSVRKDWRQLAEGAGHPFATWEWNDCWWRHFGGGRRLHCFVGRDDQGAARVILPLYLTGRLLGIVRFLGYADLASPLCAPVDRELAARALRQVARRPPCLLLAAEHLPADEGWAGRLGGRLVWRGNDPVLDLGGRTWEEILARRGRKSRSKLRRYERILVEERGLRLRLTADAAGLERDFDSLVRLHQLRWGSKGTGVLTGARGEFNREFARLALEQGWLRLWIAEVDGEDAAAWYGWRYAGSEWHYQAGRDPRFDDLSVGAVMLAHAIRAAADDEVDTFRFLAGLEDYKRHYVDRDLGTESRLLGFGPALGLGGAVWAARSRRSGQGAG